MLLPGVSNRNRLQAHLQISIELDVACLMNNSNQFDHCRFSTCAKVAILVIRSEAPSLVTQNCFETWSVITSNAITQYHTFKLSSLYRSRHTISPE